MVDDEVRIRPVQPEEAEELSVLAWRSKESWDYPMEVINELREHFLLTHEYFENNPAYLMENEETGEILGFYSLERKDDGWWLRHLWVAPEHIGMGTGSALFLDACEIA